MSLDIKDKKEIRLIVERTIDEVLDYIDADQVEQDSWVKRSMIKIAKRISKVEGEIITIKVNIKWIIGLLFLILAAVVGVYFR